MDVQNLSTFKICLELYTYSFERSLKDYKIFLSE